MTIIQIIDGSETYFLISRYISDKFRDSISFYQYLFFRVCRFSVDLSQMRSLRLFFNDENCTSGQLVIASRESQYKILHFHHGGLDHLAQVLHQWHCLLHNIKLAPGNLSHIHHNMHFNIKQLIRKQSFRSGRAKSTISPVYGLSAGSEEV